MKQITLALTGASGAAYGLRLLQQLLLSECEVFLIYSKAAQVVLATEVELKLSSRPEQAKPQLLDHLQLPQRAEQLSVLGREQWFSPVASGSSAPAAMVICPCSTGTLAAVAHGQSSNLIERAADVALKERRQLILVPRESPYSTIQLQNMLTLSQAGATILPASPSFYHRPESIEALIDSVVARVLDHLQLEQQLVPRWGRGVG
ncbi:UbiX family flavin prenyltransferase [Ectothiorhodospiraceae bacterium BW-2]|nr:UbiX family flavin prenyltransferase [Ectothiorhodospiraceae bacterium BW-2]